MLAEAGVMNFHINSRHLKTAYKFWVGFCTKGHDGNLYIKQILHWYCTYRLEGFQSTDDKIENEARVMMMSIQQEMKLIQPSVDVKPGLWMMPMMYAINDHIIHYTNIPPVFVSAQKLTLIRNTRRFETTILNRPKHFLTQKMEEPSKDSWTRNVASTFYQNLRHTLTRIHRSRSTTWKSLKSKSSSSLVPDVIRMTSKLSRHWKIEREC